MIPAQLRAWRMGLRSLRLHPLRSLLTILGILVGVASVIWLLAIGQGISSSVQRQIESLREEVLEWKSAGKKKHKEAEEGPALDPPGEEKSEKEKSDGPEAEKPSESGDDAMKEAAAEEETVIDAEAFGRIHADSAWVVASDRKSPTVITPKRSSRPVTTPLAPPKAVSATSSVIGRSPTMASMARIRPTATPTRTIIHDQVTPIAVMTPVPMANPIAPSEMTTATA